MKNPYDKGTLSFDLWELSNALHILINTFKCTISLHSYQRITIVHYKDGSVGEKFKCLHCNKKIQNTYNPNGRSGENEYDDRRGSNCC